jgi:virginiamycin A acetyltransferase
MSNIKTLLRQWISRFLGIKQSYIIPAQEDQTDLKYLAQVGAGVITNSTVVYHGLNVIGSNVILIGDINLGYATTIGIDCWLRGTIRVGNYCQLAPRVCLQAVDHSIDHLTPYNNSNLFGGDLKQHSKYIPITLGHGVWCGYGAIVLKGVQIGNGAVIGAGSVVTRDIPPYAIAVGNPAKVIGTRFDTEIQELIEQSAWWERSVDALENWHELFFSNLNTDKDDTLKLIRSFIDN